MSNTFLSEKLLSCHTFVLVPKTNSISSTLEIYRVDLGTRIK